MDQTAWGKAILAELPETRVREIIDHHGLPAKTQNVITEQEELMAELRQIRSQGFATNDEKALYRLTSLAASVTHPSSGDVPERRASSALSNGHRWTAWRKTMWT